MNLYVLHTCIQQKNTQNIENKISKIKFQKIFLHDAVVSTFSFIPLTSLKTLHDEKHEKKAHLDILKQENKREGNCARNCITFSK